MFRTLLKVFLGKGADSIARALGPGGDSGMVEIDKIGLFRKLCRDKAFIQHEFSMWHDGKAAGACC